MIQNTSTVVPFNRKTGNDLTSSMPNSPKLDQVATWIESIATNQDREAFKQLFCEFSPKIKSYAIKQGMIETSEELVQEVMVNIWRRAQQFDRSKAGGSTWIFAIARNARIDLLRKLNRVSNETQVETDYLWSLPGEDDPTATFQQAAITKQVRASLTSLPIEQREVLTKVYMEDKSHQSVANELNLPLGTVKSRVRLALQKLKVLFQEQDAKK